MSNLQFHTNNYKASTLLQAQACDTRPFPGEKVASGHETNKLGNDSPSSFSLFSFLAYNTANPPPTTISARDVHEMG